MAIAQRGASAVPAGNPTTSFTVVIPSAVLAGDLLVIAFTSRDHTSATAHPTVTDNDTGGNTWTVTALSADRKHLRAVKRATSGSAGKSVTVAGCVGSASGVLSAWSGTDTSGDPTTNLSTETNASGDEAHAGFTPTAADSMLRLFVTNYTNDNAITTPATANHGAMTGTEKLSTGGSDCATHDAHDLATGSTATGSITWAQATNAATYSTVWALKPTVADTALAGSSAGVGTAAAALTTAISLVGSSAGVGDGSSVLTTSIRFVGSAGGVSNAAGSMSNLVGESQGVASAVGALTTSIALVADAGGVAGASGSLSTAIRLVGASSATSNGDSVLTTAIPLSGSSAGAASGGGALTTSIMLGGSADAATTVTGSLTTEIALTGSAAGAALAQGALTSTAVLLAGSAAGASSAAATLATAVRLVAASDASSGASAAFYYEGPVEPPRTTTRVAGPFAAGAPVDSYANGWRDSRSLGGIVDG